VVLATAPPNMTAALEQIIGVIIERLEKTFTIDIVSRDDQNKQNDIQGLLCGVLQVLIGKLDKKIKSFSDRIMTILLRLLKSKADSDV